MKVLVCGSRATPESIYYVLLGLFEKLMKKHGPFEVVHGGARGADSLANDAAKDLGLKCKVFYPDYNLHGKVAPLLRNQQMADYMLANQQMADSLGPKDIVLAFHPKEGITSGTADMVGRARIAGFEPLVFTF